MSFVIFTIKHRHVVACMLERDARESGNNNKHRNDENFKPAEMAEAHSTDKRSWYAK